MSNQTHRDVNGTFLSLSNRGKEFWKSPRATVTRIEVLVVLSTFSLLFLATFGSRRRRSRNFLIQKGVFTAYTLSSSLLSYTLGSMQSSAVKSSTYPIWAISLYILFGGADSITAYSLIDNNQCMRLSSRFILDQLYVVLISLTILSPFRFFLVYSLVITSIQRFQHRLWASRLATRSWNLNKMVADYMYHEHTKSGPSYNPVSMRGYHYLVDWSVSESTLGKKTSYATELTEAAQVIDIERIWLCKDSALSSDLKDACLSFSLFLLLRRRFFGFECGESWKQKTHDFVFKGLLAKNEAGSMDYKRAFKVIEVELAFMYDFFFTKRAVLYHGSWPTAFSSLYSIILITLTAFMMATNVVRVSSLELFNKATLVADFSITLLILSCIVLLEVTQQILFWMGIWGRVSFVCQYVRVQEAFIPSGCRCCMELVCLKFKGILARIGLRVSSENYWQDKLGQYSLLESLRSSPVKQRGIMKKLLAPMHIIVHLVRLKATTHPSGDFDALCVRKPGKPIKLSTEVKEAVLQSLERTQGNLRNGASSLVSNGSQDLLWACLLHDIHSHSFTSCSHKTENQAPIILSWHIATCYCEMGTLKQPCPIAGGNNKLKFHLDVARTLSRYCAYLVVHALMLLPGHHYDTKRVFEAVAREAVQLLRSGDQDKYEAMRRLQESKDMSIFEKGVKLGKQLENMEEGARWKVLADFWAEMLLFVAPSDNVKEHIECLANGGEFLTHLWALLTHAGVLDRFQRNVDDTESAEDLRFRRASSYPLTRAEERAATATYTYATRQPSNEWRPCAT